MAGGQSAIVFTMNNEKTSKRVAKIAGRILKASPGKASGYVFDRKGDILCSLAELKSLAASCLTQSPNK